MDEKKNSYLGIDKRLLFSYIMTVVWILMGMLYISNTVGWSSFVGLPIAEMGSFLEGAFAPLAFLWLVIGLFIQQSVLAENNEELRRNNLHSEKQTLAIAATELNARQETFFKIAENTRRQLGAISGLLYISSQGAVVGNGSLSSEDNVEVWKQYASGDYEVFSRMFLTLAGGSDIDLKELFYETNIRCNHSNNFIVSFDRLIKQAKQCDTDNIILDSLLYSAHGLLNQRLRELHPMIKFEVLAGTNVDAYLQQYALQNID
ncbi:MAG: hypothetical protein COC19_06750 [SAR86 cluster bacterium]|uniref:Phage abortive infection protein n=1 Tax=SAR86 cluster bacterium TaxID=2030880 RepID=A0A2A4MIB5_9GAMM|nr:MAG: hypothetical protein COC19_06750 [SAR86 cluster bacterium]